MVGRPIFSENVSCVAHDRSSFQAFGKTLHDLDNAVTSYGAPCTPTMDCWQSCHVVKPVQFRPSADGGLYVVNT